MCQENKEGMRGIHGTTNYFTAQLSLRQPFWSPASFFRLHRSFPRHNHQNFCPSDPNSQRTLSLKGLSMVTTTT